MKNSELHSLIVAVFCILFAFTSLNSSAQFLQSRYWYVGHNTSGTPAQIDLSNYTSPVLSPLSSGIPEANFTGSGVYWTNGTSTQREFMVMDGHFYQEDINGLYSDGEIYPTVVSSPSSIVPGREVLIVPKPGSECGSYYVVFGNRIQLTSTQPASNTRAGLYYAIYNTDLNNGGLVTPQTPACAECESFFQGGACSSYFPASFAVSPMKTNRERFLYAIVPYDAGGCNVTTRVYKLRLTSTGIVQEDFTPGLANDYLEFQGIIEPSETELSHDQSKLAFARLNNFGFPNEGLSNAIDLVIINLNATTGNLLSSNTYNLTSYNQNGDKYTGLEFSPNSQELYINNAGDGIRKFTLSTGVFSTTRVNGSIDYSNSQLELRYMQSGSTDQRICAVRNDGGIYRVQFFNPTNGSPTMTGQNLDLTYTVNDAFPNIGGLFTLPDQVDGEDYTSWSNGNNSPACCTRYYVPNTTNYNITTSTTWTPATLTGLFGTSQPVFDGNLTVLSGHTLSLQGVTLRFHPNAKLVIQQGARVNLQGSTLTGLSCGLMWQGVRVLGTTGQAQTSTYQGILDLSAYGVRSKIEHAMCAVALYNKEGDQNALTTTGGIIQGAFTDFLNNWKDIEFRNYTFASSGSNVRYCTFIVDNNYRTTTYSHRVTLKNNFGIRFYACTFANDKTSFQTGSNTMEGIDAEDANFTVDQWCGGTPCQGTNIFRNFQLGIRAKYLTTQRNFTCKYSTFNNNFYGILSEGVNNFVTTNNTFNIGTNANFIYNVGLFVNVGTGFTIQLNNFQGVGTSALPWSTGCYIFNSGQNSNLVYKNTYNQLWEANGAENINRASSDDIGLFYQCNTQSQDLLDVYVYGGNLTNQNYGIRENHFTTTVVSGQVKTVSPNNTFSQNSSVYNGHQWNDFYLDNTSNINDNILYRYNTAASLSNPVWHTTYNPPSVTKFVDVQAAQVTNNTCGSGGGGSSLIAGGGSYSSSSEAYSAAKSAYETASYLYNSLIDNGNTELLKQSIDNWGQDAWTLRNELLAKSPNLSAEAIEYVAKEGTLPSALLFDVCFANIASVKDAKFLEMLQSSDVPYPLTAYMIQILEQADEPNSYRKVLGGALNNSILDFNFASNEMITDYLSDAADKSDSVQTIIAALPHTSSKYQLAELKLSEGETAEATAIVNGLETANPDIEKEDPNFPLYREFINYLATNRQALTSGDTLPSDIRSALETVAANNAHPGFVIANNILRADGNWTFLPVPKFPDGSYKTEFAVTEKVQLVAPTGVTLNVFPNPAKDYLTLELNYLASSPLTVELIDYTGKVVSTTAIEPSKTGMSVSNINVQQLSTGTFAVTIKEGNRKIISKVFTKAK